MRTLVVGFDSAWTAHKSGAVAAVEVHDHGVSVVSAPVTFSFVQATETIRAWSSSFDEVVVMIDQPTIVPNATGCRPVEKIVSSPVSRAQGGVQPANQGRGDMFGPGAPVWAFLRAVGASLDPAGVSPRRVIETYPVLALLGLGWHDERGHLPKYNPERKTYRPAAWVALCLRLRDAFTVRGLPELATWCDKAQAAASGRARSHHKAEQDKVDALICLLVGLRWLMGDPTIQIGTVHSGLMVVPSGMGLTRDLASRLTRLGWPAAEWLHDLTCRPAGSVT